MMNFPENVLRIIVEAVRKYPDDTAKAVDEADASVRALPEFDSLVSSLVRSAIQEVAYDIKHNTKINVKKKREASISRGKAGRETGERGERSRKRKEG